MKIEFSKKEISDISKKILDKILKNKIKKAKVIALSGDLGAGKTTLTKEIGKVLGIKNNIISPTFVIMKIYNIKSDSVYYPYFKRLIHIDAYRLNSSSDLVKIGWNELQEDKDNLIVIEWPELVKECIPSDAFCVKLGHIDEQTRVSEF